MDVGNPVTSAGGHSHQQCLVAQGQTWHRESKWLGSSIVEILLNNYHLKRDNKEFRILLKKSLIVVMVSWMYTYSHSHWVVYIKYIHCFTCWSYFNKMALKAWTSILFVYHGIWTGKKRKPINLLGITKCFNDLDLPIELREWRDRSNTTTKLEDKLVVKEQTLLIW